MSRPSSRRRSSRRRSSCAVLSAAAVALLCPFSSADEIFRTGDGPRVRGDITAGTRAGVTVDVGGGDPAVTVPTAEIAEIQWDGEPGVMNSLRGREQRGRLDDALTGYRQAAADMGPAGPLAVSDLEFLTARALGKLALNDPAQRDAAVAALEKFVADHADHHRTDAALRLLSEVQSAAENYDAAAATLDKLKESPSPQYQTAAAVASGRLALERGEAEKALQSFDAVLTDAEGRAATEARVGRATALARLNRHAEALESLDAALKETDPSDGPLRAEIHLRRGDSLQATGETKPAILEYLRVDVLYPGASAAHAESLFHLARLWNAAGFPGRAAEAASKLRSDYPNSDWAGRLTAG